MNGAQIHLLLNHVSVTGLLLAVPIAIYAIIRKSEDIKRLSLILFFLVGIITLPVYFSGEEAEEVLENVVHGDIHERIEEHENEAKIYLILAEALAAFSLFCYVKSFRKQTTPDFYFRAVTAVSMITLAFAINTAESGGKIRHFDELKGVKTETHTDQD